MEVAGSSEMLLCSEKSTQNHTPKDSDLPVIAENVLGDSGGKGSIVGGDNISHCEIKKRLYECASNSEWAASQSCSNLLYESVRFLFVGLDEE